MKPVKAKKQKSPKSVKPETELASKQQEESQPKETIKGKVLLIQKLKKKIEKYQFEEEVKKDLLHMIDKDLAQFEKRATELIGNMREEYKASLQELQDRFKHEIKKLRKEKHLYMSEYKEFTPSDIASKKLKALAEDGWKYAFEVNGKLIFQREVRS